MRKIFQEPITPEWATYTNDGRMDPFKIHKRLSDAKSAMTLHGGEKINQKLGISLYHWENNRWDLQEVRGGEDFSAPFHLGGKLFLGQTHPIRFCEGEVCAIHNRMTKLPEGFSFNWRDDTAVLEIICEHGTGHPDSNQFVFWQANNMMYKSVHGCDGCCRLGS